jgi:hypothetical protein
MVTEPVGGHGLGLAPAPAAVAQPAAENRRAALGERVALRAGESARIGNDGLDVGVETIVRDSRCPTGERCAQEGEAVVRVWLRKGSGPRETRDLQLSARAPGVGTALEHEVRLLRLDPQPVSGKATPPGDYLATLQVVPGSDAAPDR